MTAWDDARERVGLAQGERDQNLLRILLDEHEEKLWTNERAAFWDMRERLEQAQQVTLTDPQRSWVHTTCERLDIDPESFEATVERFPRFTAGPVPRGKEVESLVKDKPLRPPPRVKRNYE